MARTGRPPKPLEQKRLAGNPGKRALPAKADTLALAAAADVPPVPTSLGEHGRAKWSEIWSGPAKSWLARDVDQTRVLTVCQLVDDIAEYRRLIKGMGPVLLESVVTPSGAVTGEKKVVPNPLVRMLRDAEKNLDRELTTLAFDPVSRSRLGYTEVKTASIVEQLLSGQEAASFIEAEIIEIAPDA